MGDRTGIEWTDATWNPVRGCSRVSEGCRHCYAEGVAARFSGEGQPYYQLARRRSNGEPQWTGMIRLVPEKLDEPLRWRRPRRVFVNSMSDLFHDGVPDSFIARVFAVMALARQHTFQVLTKRPERMERLLGDGSDAVSFRGDVTQAARAIAGARWDWSTDALRWPLPNVWLGVSVEDQRAAETRVPYLLRTDAAVRFLSCEPLLGPVDLTSIVPPRRVAGIDRGDHLDALRGEVCDAESGCLIEDDLHEIAWVIVGGESGRAPDVRPMHPDWARALRDQCVAAGVPFFFKQWGEWGPLDTKPRVDDPKEIAVHVRGMTALTRENRFDPYNAGHPGWTGMRRRGKAWTGRKLDGRTWDEYPSAVEALRT